MAAKQDFNKANLHGTNKLIKAIEKNDTHAVEQMLSSGEANVHFETTNRSTLSAMMMNVPYAVGSTPLHIACLLGNLPIIHMLIGEGANLNSKNADGQTPLDMAILSHAYYETELQKKEKSRLALSSTINKAASKLGTYEDAIKFITLHGGVTGVFALPEKFKAGSEHMMLSAVKNILPPTV